MLKVMMFLILSSMGTIAHAAKTSITLYNWSNSLDPLVLKEFEKEFGIEVKEETFESNETMQSVLKQKINAFDVIVASGHMIQVLLEDSQLATVDLTKIPNFKNINWHLKGLFFDKKNDYSIPYLWRTAGIGYIKGQVNPTRWKDILEIENLKAVKGKVLMADDPRVSLGAALQYFGHRVSTTDAQEIDKARDLLLKQKEYILRYDRKLDALISGQAVLALGWSGDIDRAKRKNPLIEYVLPKEGGLINLDSFVIPKDTKYKAQVHTFINFILRPAISARVANLTGYASANDAARDYIRPDVLSDKTLYPSVFALAHTEWIRSVEKARPFYQKAWQTVKAK